MSFHDLEGRRYQQNYKKDAGREFITAPEILNVIATVDLTIEDFLF